MKFWTFLTKDMKTLAFSLTWHGVLSTYRKHAPRQLSTSGAYA